METKKIKIFVSERQTAGGKKFNVFKTFTKNGRPLEVKFTSEVKDKPTKNCVAVVDIEKMNIDNNRQFPCLWVKEVVTYEDLAEASKELNKAKINELLGD